MTENKDVVFPLCLKYANRRFCLSARDFVTVRCERCQKVPALVSQRATLYQNQPMHYDIEIVYSLEVEHCMCVCACVCMRVCVCACALACVCVYVCVKAHIHLYTCTCTITL